MKFYVEGREVHERNRKARRRNGKNEERGFVVIEGKTRKDVSFRDRQPRSPTHKVDKKEKDRTAMWQWFTPHRMTDPLSGASFNMLMEE